MGLHYSLIKTAKMENEFEVINWNDMKLKLKEEYPTLTNSDLQWRHSSKEEVLHTIAQKLKKSYRELQEKLEML
jgi:hypothetical protein